MMISAKEANANVKEYMNNYSFEAICKDVNDQIVKLSKEGKSYLCYDTSDFSIRATDSLVEKLKLHGYHVVDNGYDIEIAW